MHVRKFLSIFLIGLVFAIAGCSSSTDSGIGDLEKSPDTDGDGIANEHDGDIDGDGIPNENDDDIDGDGISNNIDSDDDGDGTDDVNDKTPEGPGDNSQSKKNCADNGGTWDDVGNQCGFRVASPEIEACIISGSLWEFSQCTPQEVANPCTSAKIIVPNEELHTGTKTKVKWKLQPEDCELTEESNVKIQVTAFNQYAKPATEKTGTPHVGKGHGQITIPNNCNWDRTTTKKITYDFTALGTALGDPQANTSAYKQDVTHPVGRGENCNPTPIVDPTFIVGPADNELTVNADGSIEGPTREGKAAVYAIAKGGLIKDLKEPTWSSTPTGYMNIYINGGAGKNERITIEPGRSNGKYYVGSEGPGAENFGTWEELQASEYGGYSVRTNYGPEVEGAASPGDPIKRGGNFVLRLNAATFTLNKYSVN